MILSLFILSLFIFILFIFRELTSKENLTTKFREIPLYRESEYTLSESKKITKLKKYLTFLSQKHKVQSIEFEITDTKYKSACSTLKSLKKPIILIDIRIIRSRTMSELYSIMAHEFYHTKKEHSKKKLYSIYLFQIFKNIFILSISGYFLWKSPHTINNSILVASFIYFSYDLSSNIIYKLFFSYIERVQEYNADFFAVSECGIDNYKKMSHRFNESAKRHRNSSFPLFDSHPSWDKRINYIIDKKKIKHNL